MIVRKLFFVLAGLSLVASISAQAADDGIYVGANLAHTDLDYSVSNQHLSPGSRDGHSGLGWSAFLGYQMNRNFALQADYVQYHEADFKNIRGVSGAKADYQQDVGDIVGKLMFPFGNGFNIFATGGVAYVKLDRDTNDIAKANNIKLSDKDTVRPTYGLGLGYDFYPGWSAQVAWTQIPSGGGIEQSNFVGAGLTFHFA